jgi:GH24 family phage-related lysozyme (muramidase)
VTYVPSQQCIADKRRWEGSSLSVYADSRGLPTQGIGRHHGVSFGDPDIDKATEERWLQEDIQGAYAAAGRLFFGLASLDDVRVDALVDLAFNMGENKLSVFQPFIKAVNTKQWSEAAFHILTNTSGHLTPYLLQTGTRAVEVALRIATGEILQEFKV